MFNFLSTITRPLGLDPSEGYDTAAKSAKDAQKQANALSGLQWQRQMQGLQGALGYVNNLQSLYNSIYGPGGGAPAAGGAQPTGPSYSQMMALSAPQTTPQHKDPSASPFANMKFGAMGALNSQRPR